MKKNNWFVITGGPSSGKSTTIRLLSRKGYVTTQEIAREFIESQFKLGLSMTEIRKDQLGFQMQILALQMKLEEGLASGQITFLDRSIPDIMAYLIFRTCPIPDAYVKIYEASKHNYKKVFILDSLSFEEDPVRVENAKEAEEIRLLLEKSYKDLGIDIVKVPVMGEEKRVSFILEHVN
ncbi:MAG: ATP-binding protein [Candidatus Levybacteria bacterium]|nr:ATP-binding protein [Candidatus Levybacteria bacterium]MBP9814901.1 ATP-binding protein [Candidatus Levybacteria bacterium]